MRGVLRARWSLLRPIVPRAIAGECWLWAAPVNGGGYGKHREIYEIFRGPAPRNKQLDHLCRIRRCVNPYHLEPVTPSENALRSPVTNGGRTHCPNGHRYSGYRIGAKRSRRACRVCINARKRAHYQPTPRKGHCKNGHELPLPNANGHRICRPCLRINHKRYLARKAARVEMSA